MISCKLECDLPPLLSILSLFHLLEVELKAFLCHLRLYLVDRENDYVQSAYDTRVPSIFLLHCKDHLVSKYNFIGRTLFAVETVNFVGNVNNTTCDIMLHNDF